jgi:hypothetical protein
MSSQVVKLGISGAEITLPTASRRTVKNGEIIEQHVEGQAADTTIHIDYRPTRLQWVWQYDVISETDYNTIKAEYDKQVSQASFLSLITTNSAGSETTYTVRLAALSPGALIQQAEWYYSGLTLTATEVTT